MNIPDDLVLVGHVTGAYGIAGWLKIHPYSTSAEALLQAKTWWLDKPELQDVTVLQVRWQGTEIVAQLMGLTGRDSAELRKGATIQVQRRHFPTLADDEFYWLDLIGLSVENPQGEQLGRVTALMDNAAHPILRVTPVFDAAVIDASGAAPVPALVPSERLIPFVREIVLSVDREGGKIVANWGLDY
ncbi:MAG: ribosome maturation factor RimM [Herbaspirillum sp.]